jgi:hypothetical protein
MTRHALIIGIQKYGGHGFSDLERPATDAEAIAQILEAHGDFVKINRLPQQWNHEKDKYEIASTPLDGSVLGATICDFLVDVGSNEALIYFSGHGFEVVDNCGLRNSYLVTSDCTTENVISRGLAFKGLNELILKSECSSLVILLDCCHAGDLLEKSLITNSLTAFNSGAKNYFFATACKSYEKAYEGTEYSLFTAAVIKALQSPGKDGRVRTATLNYCIENELRGSGQEPVILKSGGEITIVTYPGSDQAQVTASQINFPRIIGLTPFGDRIRKGAFRAYLSSEILPYYSRAAHLSLDPAPENTYIADEREILKQLDSKELDGLILTGTGGIGKTRLMFEIGHMALAENWLVYRVKEKPNPENIYQLADCIDSSQKVLLLVDYAETQQDFAALVEILDELNEDEGFHFRYIANCRSTYYGAIRGTYQHKQVDLSPPDAASEWFQRYRHETVRHILQESGIEDFERYVEICRKIPVLAVFLAYLCSIGRTVDLASLSGEASYGQWLNKRIRLSFQASIVEKDLAMLIAQFPLGERAGQAIYSSSYGQLFNRLAQDKWVEQEQLPSDSEGHQDWVTIHDVLADQILAHYLESISEVAALFVSEVLDFAIKFGSLRSTLYTFQRLIDLPQLCSLDWFAILSSKTG